MASPAEIMFPASARRMQELGRQYGDDTLVALGVFFEGRTLIKQARVKEG